jgi:CubicO group peptidase (beta-lactamase class C family)
MRNDHIRRSGPFWWTLLLLPVMAVSAGAAQAPWPTSGWPVSTPELRGLPAGSFTSLTRRIRAGEFGYVDRMVVIYDGWLIVNERFAHDYRAISRDKRSPIGCGEGACSEPDDSHQYNYLHPEWHPFYQGRSIHTLQSVTKSVTSALIGVAIQRGEISGVRAGLISFLDGYDLSHADPRLRRVTLADLLTMRSGIEWHETDRPLDETNTAVQLERSPDWIRFTLEQPMEADPGRKWVANSGASQLLSQVIRQATGRHADEYADAHLFRPLGIRDWYWKKTPTGHPDTQGGLYLDAEQLAKIGWLYVNDGVWDGQRILPEGWVRESVRKHVENAGARGVGYGYQWWRVDWRNTEIWASFGYGGQMMLIVPAHRILAVINSWNVFGNQTEPILDALTAALIAPLLEEKR